MALIYGLSDDFWNHDDFASLSDDVHATGAAIKVGYPHTGPGGLTSQADAAIAANEANGLKVIANLWTTDATFGGQPDPVDYYADRVEEAAIRWPDVDIELINEPNLGYFNGDGIRPFGTWEPEQVAEVCAEAINRVPGRCVGPAMAPDPYWDESLYFQWIFDTYDAIFEQSDPDDMLAMATHMYPIEQFTVESEVERHIDTLYDRYAKPIHITEIAFQWGFFGDHVNTGNLQPVKSVELWERYYHDPRVAGIFFFRLAPAVASEGGPSEGEIFQRFALSTNQPMEDALEEAWGDPPDPLPGPPQQNIDGWPLPGGTYPSESVTYPSPTTTYPSLRLPAPLQADSNFTVAAKATVGPELVEIPIISGRVDLDSNAASHGRLTLEVPAESEWIPTSPDDLLAPYGNEIRVYRGIRTNGEDQLTPLGVYRIQSTTIADPGDTISIEALDRSILFIDEPFYGDGQVTAGADPMETVTELLSVVYPELQTLLMDTDVPLPRLTFADGEDRWAFCQGIVTSFQGELFFGRHGTLNARPITQTLTSPEAVYTEGENLITVTRNWDRAGIYNRVIVTGENSSLTDNPRGEAIDDNNFSPTYFYGPFGHKSYRWTNSYIENDNQALAAAQGILQRTIGAPETISFTALVDVDRWPGDVVKVVRERLGVEQYHVIDTISIPLGFDGEMSMSTRAVQELPI